MTPTTAWIFMEMVIELGDVELARKASIIASKWVLKELDENFKGFVSDDRVSIWGNILKELPDFGHKREE
jgi:hypothetical protein